MIVWAVAAALLAPPQPLVSPAYAIQQSGGGLGNLVEEAVVLSRVSRSPAEGKPRDWLVEQRRADLQLSQVGWATKHRWVDGRTCPALSGVIDEMQYKLAGEDARLAAAERFGIRQLPTIPPFHTPAVILTRLSEVQPLSLRDYGGPLAKWWRRSAQTLESCWRTEPPLVAGRPVQPTIASDAVRPSSP